MTDSPSPLAPDLIRMRNIVKVYPPNVLALDDVTVSFDDGEILEIVHIVGYFNHINRVADALNVDLERWMPEK
ncbi:MAG: hypothetical protein KDC38_02935 [Planctomycetes bacterium]|nr:hypothetical protein [Planctomycetota bacterium]